jgi:homoisocitrate dehydrogenase
MTTICLIPGDGVGQEVIPAAARVLSAVRPDLSFVQADAGWDCFRCCGNALPDETLDAVTNAAATLFGATQSPNTVVEGYRSPILALRKRFDLYANLRPTATLLPGQPKVDLLIVRENTEGLYSGRERREGDTAIAERVITRAASERIARVAFDLARKRATHQREASLWDAPRNTQYAIRTTPRVTIVHKANVLKLTDGLFRESCLAVAAEYPDIAVEEILVDAAAMWLVKDPARFDVIVTTNLFGDILSDEAAGLVGGLGVAPSANVGAGGAAVFEPVHGSAPDIAGRDLANPIGAILSAGLLLEYLGDAAAAGRVARAVAETVAAGIVTADLGGSANTRQVTDAICRRLG